eukprot:6189341-Pleurochrysis_carterae.AAC.1
MAPPWPGTAPETCTAEHTERPRAAPKAESDGKAQIAQGDALHSRLRRSSRLTSAEKCVVDWH